MNQSVAVSGRPVLVDCDSPSVIPGSPDEWIFHYTNLDTLEKILTNRTLRFSRVDTFDDGREAEAFSGDLAKKFFASCWTCDEGDNPIAWRSFYTTRDTDQSKRIRIAVRKKPFRYSRRGVESMDGRVGLLDAEMAMPFRFTDMHTDDYSISRMNMTRADWFGRRVSYVDNVERFYDERIVRAEDGSLTLQYVQDFATHKEVGWDRQAEYRFVLMAGPRIGGVGVDDESSMGMGEALSVIFGEADAIKRCRFPDVTHIDMPISMDAISDMRVLLGPLFALESVDYVTRLIRAHCPSASLARSAFTGRMVL